MNIIALNSTALGDTPLLDVVRCCWCVQIPIYFEYSLNQDTVRHDAAADNLCFEPDQIMSAVAESKYVCSY